MVALALLVHSCNVRLRQAVEEGMYDSASSTYLAAVQTQKVTRWYVHYGKKGSLWQLLAKGQ